MDNFMVTIKQFFKFGLVGVSNTLISLGTYYLLYFVGVNYLVANAVGFVVSVLNSYYWNNKYVFKKTQNGHLKPLLKTFLSYGSTFLMSTVLLFALVQYVGISEVAAPIICIAITTPINFVINKLWAFK